MARFLFDNRCQVCYTVATMRVLVCGGRKPLPNDYALILFELGRLGLMSEDTVIQGGARGIDTLAKTAARETGCQTATFPAEWDVYGKAAGSVRNQKMLDEGKPDLVMAFPAQGSVGTYDMIRRAKKAGVKLWLYAPDGTGGRCQRTEL